MFALAARRAVKARTLLVVAHPDDEVLGASIILRLMRPLHLMYATDAAPADGGPEERAVARGRFDELTSALVELGIEAPERSVCPLPDGRLVEHARELAGFIEVTLDHFDVVITHTFEGGHPDHDTCALAAQTACARTKERTGRSPLRLEFPVYARRNGSIVTNCFPSTSAAGTFTLTASEATAKRRALNAFVSQRHVVDRFPLDREQIRAAPTYDFDRPRIAQDVLFAAARPEEERSWREAALRLIQ